MQYLQIEYSTSHSLKKHIGKHFDYIILDEIHEFSDGQLDVADKLVECTPTIALTGTATASTLKNIEKRTGLQVGFEYTIEEAVRDGILCDYEINVHLVELDDRIPQYESKKGRKYTEKRWFSINEFLRKKTKNPFFDNKLINIVQNSLSKLRKTKALLRDSGEERVLVFCGTTKMADSLEIPVYHSKEKDEETFRQFCEGEIPKIATVKMAKAGIKVVPINRAIFGYMNGSPETACQSICRVMAKEMWNEDKKAIIDIVALKEKFELSRLKTALMWLNEDKIKYL
jgi:superfamily II DNA or RNA helicase